MLFTVDQQVVEALAPQRPCIPLATGFFVGERAGVLMIRTPVPASRSSKAAVNLLSRSRIRNPNWGGRFCHVRRARSDPEPSRS